MTARSTPRTITSILIANRGEIARRIIRTCRRLGIRTVAAYTDPDRHLPFVADADEAVAIGSPDGYLSIDRIIAAARSAGADAIHPGYGFLSENSSFVDAVEAAGLIFVGPSAAAMKKTGDKTIAKDTARTANVPTSPALLLGNRTDARVQEEVRDFAAKVGFPLMIKASAGGGGRGMRFVDASSDITAELESARREAAKAFDNSEIFVEKCIRPARHVEVQIVGDKHGGATAIGTRDCTVQRQNQKIIEEAPAPTLTPDAEAAICDAAVRLVTASGYDNVGTAEFLVSATDGSFYFLEVNSRLQVEHTVTEMVTGLDLVEIQIRIAEGATLAGLGIGSRPTPRGHAIEARVCAESFDDTLMLSTGIISRFDLPPAADDLRLELGFEAGSEVTHHYDSLIAKVIACGATRAEAISRLDAALRATEIAGIRTNIGLVRHIISQRPFIDLTNAVHSTPELFPDAMRRRDDALFAAAVASSLRVTALSDESRHSAWTDHLGWGNSVHPSYPWRCDVHGHTFESSVRIRTTERGYCADVNTIDTKTKHTSPHSIELSRHTSHTEISVGGNALGIVRVDGELDAREFFLHVIGYTFLVRAVPATSLTDSGGGAGSSRVIASLPGKIAAVAVTQGAVVAMGDTVAVLDSMKMEHPLRAPCAGKVSSITVRPGDSVTSGTVVATIEPAG